MLNQAQLEILGEYIPTAFTIKLPGKFPDDYRSGEGFSTYIHEYIHYIQDITTVYPLLAFFRQADMLNHIARDIEVLSTPIGFPLVLSKTSEENIAKHFDWMYFQRGGYLRFPREDEDVASYKPCKYIPSIIKLRNIYDANLSPAKRYDFLCQNKAGEQNTYSLGANCIIEGMASISEKIIGHTTPSSPFIPYSIAEYFLRKNLPDLTDLDVYIVFDTCLLHEIPAIALVQIISYGKKRKLQSGNALALELYTLLNAAGEIDKSMEAVVSGFDNILSARIDNNFYDSVSYLKNIVSTAFDTRKNNPDFLVRPIQTFRANPMEFWNVFPSPLILDNQHISALSGTDVNPKHIFLFLAMQHIFYQLFSADKPECPLLAYCNLNSKNCECQTNPLFRCNMNSLCPYGYAAALFGFRGKTFK